MDQWSVPTSVSGGYSKVIGYQIIGIWDIIYLIYLSIKCLDGVVVKQTSNNPCLRSCSSMPRSCKHKNRYLESLHKKKEAKQRSFTIQIQRIKMDKYIYIYKIFCWGHNTILLCHGTSTIIHPYCVFLPLSQLFPMFELLTSESTKIEKKSSCLRALGLLKPRFQW